MRNYLLLLLPQLQDKLDQNSIRASHSMAYLGGGLFEYFLALCLLYEAWRTYNLNNSSNIKKKQ